jgi:signal transduction histidine kinase
MSSPEILPIRRVVLLAGAVAILTVLAAALFAWHGVDAGARRLEAVQVALLPQLLALEQLRHDSDAPIRSIDAFAAQATLSRFSGRSGLADERPQMDEAWQALADALAAYAARDAAADGSQDRQAESAYLPVLAAGQRLLDQLRAAVAGVDRGASPVALADSGRLLRAGIGQFRGVLDENLGSARRTLATQLATVSAAADRAWWMLGAMLPMLVLTLAGASVIVRRAVRPSRGLDAGMAQMERRRPAAGRRTAGEPNREMTMIDDWLSRALATYPLPEGIALHSELMSDAQAALEQERFRRMLVILLDNAVRAMTDQPWVSSNDRARSITVRSEAAGPHLRLSVMDTGPGIPAERLAGIFDGVPGTGEGLPAVRQIVEEHGGTIDIESATDQGTDIVIWLPRQLIPVASAPSAHEEEAA